MSPAPEALHPLLTSLASALSPSQEQRQASLAQLQAWTTLPGYYASLVEIFSRRELELGTSAREIRLQAVVQFKNGVERHWRRGALNGIAAEEKRVIRGRLLTMVDEPDRVLAKNVALCIAKIARLDYGTEWEDLPTSLIASINYGLAHPTPAYARVVLHRSLLFLHATIKSLASNRIMKGRLILASLGAILFPTLRQLHEQVLAAAVDKLRTQGLTTGEDIEDVELALLSFKSLAKLIVYGFKDASIDDAAKAFFASTVPTLSSLIALRLSLLSTNPSASHPTLVILTKQVISYGKLYRLLLSQNAAAFVAMGATGPMIELYWQALQGAAVDVATTITDEPNAPYPERFVVQSLLLLKATMGDWASASPVDVSPDFVRQFAGLIVTRLLPLRPVDLEKWGDDPEEWMNEEEADRWEYELRPCAEHVLQSLLSHYKAELGPSMASLLQQSSDPQNMEGLLLKEGIYCAFGRSPSDLEGSIDFDKWLDQTLVVEAAGIDSNHRIIRRRIAWLVGNWVGEDLSQTTRTKIYALLIHLIGRNASTDTAIRLTAARSLSKCDTWDFDRDSFVPFLPAAIEEIVSLLGEVTLADSQMRLNQTLGVVIDRVGSHIGPYAPRLAEILSTLWTAAQENHFQASVLVTLTKLSEALGEHSAGLQLQACPIINFGVDPSRASHVYLQEDALDLWHVLLKRSAILSPEMLDLIPLLMTLLAAGTDVLPVCLRILDSYLLLDPARVLQLCSSDLFTAFEILMGDLKPEAVKKILRRLNTLFQVAPIELWAPTLDASGAFVKIMTPMSGNDSALIVSQYLCTISRIVLASPDIFHQLIQATAVRTGVSSDDLLTILLNQWIERLDNMSQGSQRKLTALALAHLIPTTRTVILSRIPELVSLWSGVLAETEETETGDAELYRIPDDYDSEIDYAETLESARRQACSLADPVHSVKLNDLIRTKLGEAESLNGGQASFASQYLSLVDPLILEELQQRLQGTLAG